MKRMILMMAAAGLMVAYADDIPQRKENQQQRIGNGVKNGSLTPEKRAIWRRRKARLTTRSTMIACRTAAI